MIFREANEKDINSNLFNIYTEAFHMHYEEREDIFYRKTGEDLKANLADLICNPEDFIFVMEENGYIIGYIAFKIKNNVSKSIWISEIAIDKSYRNKGYGKQIMEKIYEFAQKNKCKRVELNCWAFNQHALDFYNVLGFNQQRIILEKEVN